MKQNDSIVIRKYQPTDKDDVLNLMKLNTPDFLQRKRLMI